MTGHYSERALVWNWL